MAQTTVTQFATPGFIGYLAEQRASDVLKAGPLVQDEQIAFGVGLVLDPTQDFAVKLPSALTGQTFAGVVYNAQTLMTPLANGAQAPHFVQYDAVTYCARGAIWVAPEQDITIGEPVYMRVTTSGDNTPGHFTNVPDGVAATSDTFTITYSGSITAYGVTVNGVALPTTDTIAGLMAELNGNAAVLTTSLVGSVLTITGVPGLAAMTLTAAVGTGGTATLARTATGANATYKALLLSNCRWLTNATAGEACKLEINTP